MKSGTGALRLGRSTALLQANLSVTGYTVGMMILLFLSARANIGGTIPFGVPACAALLFSEECTRWPLNRILYILCVILGSASLGRPLETAVVASAILLFAVLSAFLIGTQDTMRHRLRAGIAVPPSVRTGGLLLLCIFVPSVLLLSATDASFGDFLRLSVQMLVMFIAFYAYCHARNGYTARKNAVPVTQEQMACFCVAIVVALMGLPDIIIAGISTVHVVAICLILLFACMSGFGAGAAAGTVAGLLMASGDAVYMCLYALGGFLAGLMNRYRKFGAVLGFVSANVLLACLMGGSRRLVLGMYESGFAAVLFLLLPKKPMALFDIPMLRGVGAGLTRQAADRTSAKAEDRTQAPLLGENYLPTGLMIGQVASCMDELARISGEISKNAGTVFEAGGGSSAGEGCVMRIYGRICARCTMKASCWNGRYARTYKSILRIAENAEQGAEEDIGQAAAAQAAFCPNTEQICAEARKVTAMLRAERVWRGKNAECRRAASLQLESLSRMIYRAGEDINGQRKIFYELRDRTVAALENADVTLYDFSSRLTRSAHLEIRLSVPKQPLLPCGMWRERDGTQERGGTRERGAVCRSCGICEQVLTKVSGRQMQAESLRTCERNICTVLFREQTAFAAGIGSASAKAYQSECSGDCFCRFATETGSVYAVLSDGMGTGIRANRQSAACLHLIRLFLEGGLNFGEAAEAVDTLIAASGDGETVSAGVDALYLDLYQGTVRFAKRGAAPSYLLGGADRACEEISISDAPLGFHGTGEQTVQKHISDDCAIVMLSDGICDAFSKSSDGDPVALVHFLTGLYGETALPDGAASERERENAAQNMAQRILRQAICLSDGRPKDDMTVAVILVARCA